MIKITVLLENSSVSDKYESKHGLSLLIDYNDTCILLDAGPDNKFIKNAEKMNIDLSKVRYLFLSHNHYDHTGGINDFIKVNSTAGIYLMDDIDSKYYAKGFIFYKFIGSKPDKSSYSRVIKADNDLIIDSTIHFLKNTACGHQKPTFNKVLYKKDNGKRIKDNFDHEGILVLEDNNELVIFNSCSHNGLLNIMETVKTKIPDKRIRAYAGGLHLCNPTTKEHEDNEYLDHLIDEIKRMGIVVYTGHCTGKYAMGYMKEKLGERLQEINTGMKLNV